MAYYLGIDGGGTKTRCVLGDETTVLGTAVSGGSNFVRLGDEPARAALESVIRQACIAAKIEPVHIRAVCIGAAGAARPEIEAKIRAVLAEIHPSLTGDRLRIVGDTVIALEAAFGSGPGVIAISGTGSAVFGRDGAGKIARAGGWGFAVSDEGSGQWIGRHAVSAVLRARDEGRETELTAGILEAWKLPDLDALIRHANSTPSPEFPRLFPVVLQTAKRGDETARELLSQAGTELAKLAAIVLRRISPGEAHVPVATTGSVFRQSEEVRRVFYNELNTSFPGIEFGAESIDPVMGALALARAGENTKRG
jgi:glucosamine kinase